MLRVDSDPCVDTFVVNQLQEKANLLTAERKKRGKKVPEDLVPSDDIRAYRPLASHPVSNFIV